METYLRQLGARPALWLLLCLFIAGASATGLRKLSFSADYQAYFAADNPYLVKQRELEKNFPHGDVMVVSVTPQQGDLFNNATLAVLAETHRRMERLPYARTTGSLDNFYTPAADGDDIRAERLVPTGPLSPAQLDSLRKRALNEPRILRGLISEHGDVAGIYATLQLPHLHPAQEIQEAAEAARELVQDLRREHPDHAFHLAGATLFNRSMAEAAQYDARHLYPAALALMGVLLWFALRGMAAVLATFAVTGLAIATGLGLAGLLGFTLTTASASAGLMIMTLAVSDSVHILTSYFQQRSQGMEAREATFYSLRANFLGVFLTTFTTIIGFLSFNTSESPPFRDLGNIVAIGVAAAYFYSLIFLPSWMLLWPPRGRPGRHLDFSKFANWVIRHHVALRWSTLGITLAFAACIPLNHFGDNYVKFFGPQLEFRRDTEYINERLTGMQFVEWGVPSGSDNGTLTPEYLQKVEEFSQWLRARPEVKRVNSLNEVMKRLNETLHGGDPAWYRLPDSQELAAQVLLFYEMSLPPGVDLSNLVNWDKSWMRVSATLDTISNEQIRQLDLAAQQWMAEHWPAPMQTQAGGIAVMFAYIAQRNFISTLTGDLLTFAVICVIFFYSFKSWRVGLISLIPNFAPVLIGFGAWGLLVGEVGMSLSIVFSLTLGIVVDDTIHFLARYSRARQSGLDAADSVRVAYSGIGEALLITTLVLVVGFGTLAASSFQLSRHLGMLTSGIIGIALLGDFLMLPALLIWLDRGKK